MALVETAGAAFAHSNTNTVTTGSYTPTAGTLQVAIIGVGDGNGIGTTSVSVTDTSGSGSWTALASVTTTNAGRAYIYIRDAWSGAATVTFTSLPSTVIDCCIITRQFAGALAAASQTGVTATQANTSSQNKSITPGTTGSQVVGGFGTSSGAKVLVANATTSIYGQYDGGPGGDTEAAVEATALSTSGTPVSIGFTNTAALSSYALAEILPSTSTTLLISAPTATTTYGNLAISAAALLDTGSASTLTWTSLGNDGFTNSVNDGATSSVAHVAVDTTASTGGAQLSNEITVTGGGNFGATPGSYAAAATIVLFPQSGPGVAMSTLVDTFVTNDLATQWANSAGTLTVSGNQVGIACDTSYDSVLESTSSFDIRGTFVFAQMTPFTGTTATEMGLQLINDEGNLFSLEYVTPDLLAVIVENGVSTTIGTEITYNATTHAWWRIREASGTVFFDTAPDGVTWTNQWSSTYTLDASAMFVEVYTGVDTGTSGTSFVANVNTTGTTSAAMSAALGPLATQLTCSVAASGAVVTNMNTALAPLAMQASGTNVNGIATAMGAALGPLATQLTGTVVLPAIFPQVPLNLLVELFVNGAWTDITSQVYQRDTSTLPTITRGRQNEASTLQPGQMTLTLNNRNGQFSPRNPLGPYYGSLGRNTQLRISAPTDPTQENGMAYRFWGEVPSWPPSWDNTGTDVYVQVTVSGITRRLGQPGTASLGSALNEYYTTLSGASAPVAYWPCDDQSGAVTFASAVPNIAPMQFSGAPQLSSDSAFGGSLALPVLAGSIWFGTLGSTSLASTTNTRVFTPGTGTWTAPAGTGVVTVEEWGAGAGGAAAGGCGGGGGQFCGDVLEVTAGSVYPYAVGSGGAGATTPTGTGSPGGLTMFAGNSFVVTANGGTGGTPSNEGVGGTGGGSVANDGSGNTSPNAVSFDGGRGGDSSSGAAGGIGTNGSLIVANSAQSTSWTAPSTINSQVTAHAWGAGGGGGGGQGGGSPHAGGGGAGGNFGTLGITVTPGNNYNVTAGAGGTGGQPGFNGGNGSASGFTGNTQSLTIHGGFGGESGPGGGTGGTPSGDAQAATFGGGGATGITTTGGGGGGGASGATPGGNGGTATGRGGGAGGAAGGSDIAGGAGGSGGNPGVAGGFGAGPGGGGAGSGGASTAHGGNGADGRVELFWTNLVPQTASGGGAGGSSGGTGASGTDGAAGSGATGGINTAPPSGAGAGGNGGSGTGSFNGLAGAVPGGGGGAGGSFTNSVTNVTTNGNGAAGANGQLVLSWTTTTVVGGGGAQAAANVLRFLMQVPLAGDTTGAVVASMLTTGTITELDVIYLSGGALQLRGFAGSTIAFDSGPLAFGVNGNPVLVSAELVQNGASITWEIATSTLGAGSVAIGTSGSIAGSVSSVTGVIVNPSGGLQGTSVGQVTVQYTDTLLSGVAAAASGYAGETAGARFTRLCAQNNVPSVVLGDPSQTVLMGSQQPDTLIDLLQSCEDADRGQLFEPRDSFGLGYRTRVDMSNQAPGAALDYSRGQLVPPLTPTDDDALTANDVTVQRTGGSSHEVALLAGPMSVQVPPNGINRYTKSYTEVLYSDGQLPSAAGWLLSLGTVDQQRFPEIAVNLARPATVGVFSQVVATDIGDLLTVANPPAWMPPEVIQQLLVGWTETLGPQTWTIGWNCAPAVPYFTGILGDPLFGQPDTDGSALVNAVSSTATSLLVAPTGSGYPLWTTASSDFPFDVIMAGERMTVTRVTGTSASGQVFTVTRSVNGIVTAQNTGAAVSLFYPLIEGM